MKSIELQGVKQNNLKNIDLNVELGSFTVICGPSGSGKSSLAFETLFAEGQRRYIESLSNYTKQFLNKAPKPDLDEIRNVPPSVAIEQRNSVKSSRSSLGTSTEIADYLRILYEKLGKAYCPNHHTELRGFSPSTATPHILRHFESRRAYLLVEIPEKERTLKGKALKEALSQEGYRRILLAPEEKKNLSSKTKKPARTTTKKVLSSLNKGSSEKPKDYGVEEVGEIFELDDKKWSRSGVPKGTFYLVIDRLALKESESGRITDSLAQAFAASLKFRNDLSSAQVKVLTTEGESLLIGEDPSCGVCGFTFPPITSALFSFNSPVGACTNCNGFGNSLDLDEEKIIPNPKLSLSEGAIAPFAMPSATTDRRELKKYCRAKKISMSKPWQDLPEKIRNNIWDGTEDFYGVRGLFEYLEKKKYKMHVRVFLSRFKSAAPCSVCKGTRLKKEAQQVLIQGQSISDLCALSAEKLSEFLEGISLSPQELKMCEEPLLQARSRLRFLKNVGVGYLSLDRQTRTLSGGEFQRINLANQLGMALSQTLYVLDEPTIGLHPRDNERLIEILKDLKNLGNTLVVVEHDQDVIESSERLIEMGPGSGIFGGKILFSGKTTDFYKSKDSLTLSYLKDSSLRQREAKPRPVPSPGSKKWLKLSGCSGNNLKNINFEFPLNRIVTVTGVSGSGKSTLVTQTLYPALARELDLAYEKGAPFKKMTGHQVVEGLVFINQSRIGKTARSNPATYLKIFDGIRTIFSGSSIARERGYTPGTFSLNVDGGRCPVCKGLGFELIDMVFMDDVEIGCENCQGQRFRSEVLEIEFHGKNISDVLRMTVAEAIDFFVSYPNIRRPLIFLKEVGLDYIRLGQSANSLSGGESQRLKVAKELMAKNNQDTLYILDEPTTGLHFREVQMLMNVLNRLVDGGASVVLIEHNLDVIKNSDYIVDLGPEAGEGGGDIVAFGTPDEIAKNSKSLTGQYLKKSFQGANSKTTSKSKKSVKKKSLSTSRQGTEKTL